MKYFFIQALLIAATASAFAQDAVVDTCPTSDEIIKLIFGATEKNKEAKRLFVRDVRRSLEDKNYLRNMADSVQDHFAPWFENKTKHHYREMLKSQHQALMLGRDGKSIYQSPTQRYFNWKVKPSAIGNFRNASDEFGGGFIYRDICARFKCPPDFAERIIEYHRFKGLTLDIEGIPEQYQLTHKIKTEGSLERIPAELTLYYPAHYKMEHYLNRMETLATSLRSIPKNSSLETWIEPLADYVQVFSVTLPFEVANYSLAMSHVNYFLLKQGLRGVEHGIFDYLAMVYPSKDFRKLFKEAVLAAQK